MLSEETDVRGALAGTLLELPALTLLFCFCGRHTHTEREATRVFSAAGVSVTTHLLLDLSMTLTESE